MNCGAFTAWYVHCLDSNQTSRNTIISNSKTYIAMNMSFTLLLIKTIISYTKSDSNFTSEFRLCCDQIIL